MFKNTDKYDTWCKYLNKFVYLSPIEPLQRIYLYIIYLYILNKQIHSFFFFFFLKIRDYFLNIRWDFRFVYHLYMKVVTISLQMPILLHIVYDIFCNILSILVHLQKKKKKSLRFFKFLLCCVHFSFSLSFNLLKSLY